MKLAPPSTPTLPLARPLTCTYFHTNSVARVVTTATHRTAYCATCGIYIKHLGAKDLASAPIGSPKPIDDTLPFYVVVANRNVGKGVETVVVGTCNVGESHEAGLRPTAPGVTIKYSPALPGVAAKGQVRR